MTYTIKVEKIEPEKKGPEWVAAYPETLPNWFMAPTEAGVP